MARWRLATKAFLIFNLVMVGLLFAVLIIAGSQTEFMFGWALLMGGTSALIIVWPIGLIVLGIAWLVGRRSGQADGTAQQDRHHQGHAGNAVTPPGWRTEKWAFIIFNVVMVGLVWLVLSSDFMGGLIVVYLGFVAVVIIWPIGAIVLGKAWLVGRR
jgi:hypothetical protein